MNKNIIGAMRHEMQLLTPVTSVDSSGAEVITWNSSNSIWCQIEYLKSGSDENNVGQRIHAFTNILIRLRYDSTVTTKMRVNADGFEWNIKSILPDHRREFMTLECEQDKPNT